MESGDLQIPIEAKESGFVSVQAIRHAPTQFNLENRTQGQIDAPIITEGIELYHERFGTKALIKPDVVILSGLKRTRQTYDEIARFNGWEDVAIVSDPRLNERNWGDLQGMTHEEIRAHLLQDPKAMRLYPNLQELAELPIWLDPRFVAKGGESVEEVQNRVKEALVDLAHKFPDKKVLLVGHSGSLLSQGFDPGSINSFKLDLGENHDMRIERYVDDHK